MLELEKIFLLVRFFNIISCSKGLKAKISRFYMFFQFNPLRLERSRSFLLLEHSASFLMSSRLKKFKNPASMELQEWSKNVVNVVNHHFLKEKCKFLSVI